MERFTGSRPKQGGRGVGLSCWHSASVADDAKATAGWRCRHAHTWVRLQPLEGTSKSAGPPAMPLAPIAAPRQRTDFPLAGSYMRAASPATALTDGAHHRLALVHKLAANVDVAGARAHAHACSIRSGGPGAVHLSEAGSSCLAWRCMSSGTSSICHCEGQLERACTPGDATWRAKCQLVQWHDSHARPPERHATPDGWPLGAPTRSLQQRCIIPTVRPA